MASKRLNPSILLPEPRPALPSSAIIIQGLPAFCSFDATVPMIPDASEFEITIMLSVSVNLFSIAVLPLQITCFK